MIDRNEKIYTRVYNGTSCELVDINHLRPEQINIHGIGHVLSLLCRYGGNLPEHYSVAQHSVIVSQLLEIADPVSAMWGLMHDAAEAYIVDLVSPVKKRLPDYVELENRILQVIAEKFNLVWPVPPIVKKIGAAVQYIEQVSLQGMLDVHYQWGIKNHIVPVSALEAEIMFQKQFLHLRNDH